MRFLSLFWLMLLMNVDCDAASGLLPLASASSESSLTGTVASAQLSSPFSLSQDSLAALAADAASAGFGLKSAVKAARPVKSALSSKATSQNRVRRVTYSAAKPQPVAVAPAPDRSDEWQNLITNAKVELIFRQLYGQMAQNLAILSQSRELIPDWQRSIRALSSLVNKRFYLDIVDAIWDGIVAFYKKAPTDHKGALEALNTIVQRHQVRQTNLVAELVTRRAKLKAQLATQAATLEELASADIRLSEKNENLAIADFFVQVVEQINRVGLISALRQEYPFQADQRTDLRQDKRFEDLERSAIILTLKVVFDGSESINENELNRLSLDALRQIREVLESSVSLASIENFRVKKVIDALNLYAVQAAACFHLNMMDAQREAMRVRR